jgi:hypothetical protein
MLSPHEIAALMLLDANQNSNHLDLEDLSALCERQLVSLEKLASGYAHVCLTPQGRSVLRLVGQRH